MNCQQFRQTIEQAEDDHRRPQVAELKPHLDDCSECRRFWDARRRLYAALQASSRGPRESPRLTDRVLLAVRETLTTHQRSATGPRNAPLSIDGHSFVEQPASARSRWAVGLVGVCLALFCGVILRQGSDSPRRQTASEDSRAASIAKAQQSDAGGPLPQILEGVEDSYRALTSDAMASLKDVVALPAVPQFGVMGVGLESSAQPPSHTTPAVDAATDSELPLKDVFDFLRQLVPADGSATL